MSHRRPDWCARVAKVVAVAVGIAALGVAAAPASAQQPVKITLWHAMGGAR